MKIHFKTWQSLLQTRTVLHPASATPSSHSALSTEPLGAPCQPRKLRRLHLTSGALLGLATARPELLSDCLLQGHTGCKLF